MAIASNPNDSKEIANSLGKIRAEVAKLILLIESLDYLPYDNRDSLYSIFFPYGSLPEFRDVLDASIETFKNHANMTSRSKERAGKARFQKQVQTYWETEE